MTPISPEERPLLEAVRNAPDDDGPRLVYADWFDDRGDPRGRLIRIQLALARLSEYEPRRAALREEEQQLLAQHETEWTQSLHGVASGIVFRRGFIDEVNMTARQFFAHADSVFDLAPIRNLHLLDAGQNFARVLASPLLTRLAGFSLYAQYLGGSGPLAQKLAAAKTLAGLQKLNLGRNRMTDDDLRLLALAPLADSIVELDLHENDITDTGATRLTESNGFPKLSRLNLSQLTISPAIASAIANTPYRSPLRSLSLAGNPSIGRVSTGDVKLFHVAELDLSETGLTVLSLNRLLESVHTPATKILRLAGNMLGDGGAAAIAESAIMAELRDLDLRRNEIGALGVERIAGSTMLARLDRLDITSNPIELLGWATLLTAKGLTSLRKLELPTAGISSTLRDALDRRFNAKS